ncbi:hypothetical protein [Streptomyces boninensis]|uniref:hypothetical protein n=1 Tax=Streptomyces boninensis TaxID=2039455 RepID=UPI003B224FFA
MWDDAVVAARTSDAKHPRLNDHADDGALGLLRLVLRDYRKYGLVAQGEPRLDPQIVSEDSKRVVVRDCLDDEKWQIRKRDGSPPDVEQGTRERIDATVTLRDGAWVVTRLKIHEPATC